MFPICYHGYSHNLLQNILESDKLHYFLQDLINVLIKSERLNKASYTQSGKTTNQS